MLFSPRHHKSAVLSTTTARKLKVEIILDEADRVHETYNLKPQYILEAHILVFALDSWRDIRFSYRTQNLRAIKQTDK